MAEGCQIRVEISSPYVGTREVSYVDLPEDWEHMTADERMRHLDMLWEVEVSNYVDVGIAIVNENGEEADIYE